MSCQGFRDELCKLVHDMHTGVDGVSYDWGRVWGSIGAATFIWLSIWSYCVKGTPFDPVTWGAGLSAVLVGVGMTLLAKAKTEPQA